MNITVKLKSLDLRKFIFTQTKGFLVNNIDLICFLVLLTFKAINYDKEISPEYFSYNLIFMPVFSSLLILVSFTLFFRKKIRTRILFSLNIIFSIILYADANYYRYSKDVISLATIRNGSMLGGVTASVISLIKPSDIFYFIDIIIIIPILIIFRKVQRTDVSFPKRIIVFILLISVGGFIDGDKIYNLHLEQPRLISTMFNKIYLNKMLGDINFHVLDAYNVVSTNLLKLQKLSPDKENEIKSYLTKKNSSTSTNLTNAYSNKNLIVIQVEALQQFVINKKINGQEITPNLNRWLNKSLYFDNYFYQVAYGNTSDAEFLSNNSLYPAASGAAYYMYCGDTFDSLAKQLNDKGYYSAALHGYQEGFWNRNVMYKAEKFDDFYGEKTYNIDENVGLGLSDKSFFNQSLTKLDNFKQPYFSFLITLSSHYPYDDVKGYGNFDTGKYENTFMGNYLKGIHYADAQLGMFLDNLDKQGTLDNSVLVLYGDHFAIPKSNIDQLYDFEGINNATDLDWYEEQKVPMFIHFPKDANKGINHIYSGQIDLYPTIANLMGLDKKYMFGEDLLNNTSNLVKFRNGSFSDGNSFYVSWTETYYDIKSKQVIPETDALKTMKNNTLTELEYSDDILNHNLIKKFLSEDSKK